MSELISGKEAWIAKSDKKDVQYSLGGMGWCDLTDKDFYYWSSDRFLDESLNYKFRLKPRTITLNGVEVEELRSSEWNHRNPKEVILEFKNESAARFFHSKALEIFNNIK